MTKVMSLLLRVSLVVLLVGIVFFRTILQVFFPLPTPETATAVARPKSETSRLDDAQVKGPSSDISSTREKPIATKESLQSTERLQANRKLTEVEKLQLEQQRVFEEQAEQEAAAYEESLRSTEGLQATPALTEEEQLQLEQQRVLEDQAEQEAAAYEESLQSSSFAMPKR